MILVVELLVGSLVTGFDFFTVAVFALAFTLGCVLATTAAGVVLADFSVTGLATWVLVSVALLGTGALVLTELSGLTTSFTAVCLLTALAAVALVTTGLLTAGLVAAVFLLAALAGALVVLGCWAGLTSSAVWVWGVGCSNKLVASNELVKVSNIDLVVVDNRAYYFVVIQKLFGDHQR